MILMRISKIKGDCDIDGYEKWITLEGISFNVGKNIESKSKGLDIEIKKNDEPQSISVDKLTDCASADLMYRAVKDRTPDSSVNPGSAEIHFVEVRDPGGTNSNQKSIKAFLKIKLGRVLIKEWSITGDQDSRPTESLALSFDQLAMEYHATTDGKLFDRYGPRGWDTAAGKDWKPPEWD
jgi:type VI protein secretion system component Hcp